MDNGKPLWLARTLKLLNRAAPLQTTEAFSDLYVRAHVIVFRYAYGLSGGTQEEAEDLAAETFARAWKAREGFNGSHEAAVGWLLQITRRLVIDAYRRRVTSGPQEPLDERALATLDASPEEQTLHAEQTRILWGLMQTLPIEQKEMLVLRYLLGWKVNQIADQMGLNENTVSVSIRRTLTRLARNWPQAEDEG
jgi:RNA polymerase sigma-70 factor (ECF subfamily)